MKYSVLFPSKTVEKKFLKALSKIPSEETRKHIKRSALSLADDPRPYGEPKLRPPLDVYNYVAQYRVRVGDYRILYDVDDVKKKVWILALRRRNERTY
jgi:mRNA interferase RelE/StbE